MIRFYLGEEPLVAAVPTLDLGRADHLEAVLGDLRGHVVKPRFGHGGAGVVVCAHADDRTLDRLRDQLTAAPEGFVAQPLIAISSHPTVIGDGRLEPRHVEGALERHRERHGVDPTGRTELFVHPQPGLCRAELDKLGRHGVLPVTRFDRTATSRSPRDTTVARS